jgi:PKD repeat protein
VAAFESDPFLRGRLQAVGIGSVAAHATVQGVSGAIAVVVTPAVLVSIEVRPKVMELVLDGDTPARFSAIGIYSDSTESDITTAVLWDVADPAIASIANEPSKKGLVLGKSVGETVVTASLSGISSSADLQVLSPANPLVALTVNGSATGLVIPKRAGLAVAWRSQHATSCQAFRDGVVFDNRLAGESSVVADANTLFSIRCVNRLGVLATAEVPVVVTSPTVNLTVNNQTGPVTVFSGDTVSVSWTSAHAITCEARGDDTLIGRELAASDKRMLISKTTTFVVMCRDAMENLALASVTVLQHSLNVMVQAGNVETVPGSSINRPLAIYFALDVTGSMGGVISTVKTNIQAFVDELRAKRFDVRLGVIPFRDSIPSSTEVPEGRFDLSDDIDAFKTYVGGLRATGGGDGNESGLIAIESALEELNTRETRADALKVILVITDNPSHRGAAAVNGQRDCAIGVTTNRFNAMPADVQKSVKLFYSAASGGQLCSGFSTAAGQFAALVSGALTAESDVAKRGGSIPWPFDATALVSTFAEMIQRTAPAIDLVCLNQSATLSMSPSLGGLVVNWSGNLSGVYADYKASRPVSVYSKVMTKAERDLFIGAAAHGDVDLEVTRCCVSRDSADRGDFATCHKTTRTNPGFAIEEL